MKVKNKTLCRMVENQSYPLNIININPEPIGIFTLPIEKHLNYKKSAQLIEKQAPKELRQHFPTEKYTAHICNNYNQNIFNQFQTLSNLKKDLTLMILTYIKTIGHTCKDVVINDAWLNNSSKNSTLAYHYHSNSYISGNYFINFNHEIHTQLNFLNDRILKYNSPNITTPKSPDINTLYNSKTITLNAKEGQVFIWRSHNSHGYSIPNKGDKRLTLSFNSMPKTCINSDERYSFSVVD